jgi:hypothetical protein
MGSLGQDLPAEGSVVSGSVPEIQAVETRAFKPAVVSVGKVHREIYMSTQGPETGGRRA